MNLMLIRLSNACRVRGLRALSALLLELGSIIPGQKVSIQQLVIDLMSVGLTDRARNKILSAKSNRRAILSFNGREESFLAYIDWKLYGEQVRHDLERGRLQIVKLIKENKNPSQTLTDNFGKFSDFILISNARIKLSRKDIDAFKCMRNPVFVLLNHANQNFQETLVREGLHNIPHILFAGANGLIDDDFRLMYKSYGIYKFNLLACFVKNANLHKSEWLDRIKRTNDGTSFFALDEITHELNKIYKSNIIFNLKHQGPSIGWYVIELLSAMIELKAHMRSKKSHQAPIIWLVGFDLSPVYVFESHPLGGTHDFVYEYIALQVRYTLGMVKKLGSSMRNKPSLRPPLNRLTNEMAKRLADRGEL